MISNFYELSTWVEINFKNLDKITFENQENEIYRNSDFGLNKKQRKVNLAKAKKYTKIINTISWIIGISTWLTPIFYNFQIMLCASLPILGLVIHKSSKGLIRLDEAPNSPYPNIHSTLIIPSLILLIRALEDFIILNYSIFLNLFLLISIIFSVAILKNLSLKYSLKKTITYVTFLGVLIISGSYTYGIITITNAIFSSNTPVKHKVVILDKRISSGKNTSYYLKLDKWGTHDKIDEISVNKKLYDTKKIGSSINVFSKIGVYNIPFYYIEE